MLTNDERAAIAERERAATRGPWKVGGRYGVLFDERGPALEDDYEAPYGFHLTGELRPAAGGLPTGETAAATAAFIAASRTDIPALLAHASDADELIAGLVGALTTIEWLHSTHNGVAYCPYCGNRDISGHKADCVIAAALADPRLTAVNEAAAGEEQP